MKIIKNVTLYDYITFRAKGFIAFEDQIMHVGLMSEYKQYFETCCRQYITFEVIEGHGKMLLPGMVLGHTHIYSTFARGWSTPFSPKTFQDILDQLWWKLDKALKLEDIYYSGISAAYQYLSQGITTIIDHHASGTIRGSLKTLKKAVVDDMGLRGVFCFETSDRFDVEACIDENESFYKETVQLQSADARGLLGIHASMSLSEQSMSLLGQTDTSMPIHIHVAESIEDIEITQRIVNKTIIQRLDNYGLLRPKSLYVHGVHLDQQGYELIQQRKGLMVYCPTSNMNNGVGLPSIDKGMKGEVPWLVGNDGLGFGLSRDYQNIVYGMHLMHPHYFQLHWLKESILSSYDYISQQFQKKIGRLESGYEADFILLDYASITPVNEHNIFEHFFYGMLEQWRPKEVWIKGELRLHNFQVVKDMREQLEASKSCAKQLWERLQE